MLADAEAKIPLSQKLHRLFQHESAGGVLLLVAMVVAMGLDNSPLAGYYDALLDTKGGVVIGKFELVKPLLLWINDGLMAIFFLLIGLEVKREILEGQLSDRSQLSLPGLAAVGGMVVPALIYYALNRDNPTALEGWAIPTATDIAFALGILSLFGKRVPGALKLFLLTLAILDDLAAIVVIALFYSGDLSGISLILAAIFLAGLIALNLTGRTHISLYGVVGLLLWVAVLKSGVHATLAGVALAFAIPLRAKNKDGKSPLRELEHDLEPWVAFGIMPIFAFANSGVSLAGVSWGTLLAPVPLGIIAGLFIGKQIGVFGFSFVAVKLGIARLSPGVNWAQLYGVALLCGIGFTMSLFIGSLAFAHTGTVDPVADRLGILVGSFLSAILGSLALALSLPKEAVEDAEDAEAG